MTKKPDWINDPKEVADSFWAGFRLDKDYSLSEWSDDFVMLPSKSSAEPGRYRTDRVPFLREIMECLSHQSPVKRVVFMKSAQVGGSQLALNWLGYIMDICPAPVMIVQPTLQLAERFSKQRVQPLIDETPRLKPLVNPTRMKDSGNTLLLKEFRGGVVILTGANSPTSLRSMPIRFAMLDEVDAYPAEAGEEGSPVALAEKRTTTFRRRKIFLISTPTTKESSVISTEFDNSDQRRYFVPCPECGGFQYLQFKNLKWDPDHLVDVRLSCEHCGALIEEKHKSKMMREGEWRATSISNGETVGFHINALYSPWMTWMEIVKEFLKCKSDAPLLRTFINTILGEPWEEDYSAKVGAGALESRAEAWDPNVIPKKVACLVAGVDVQDNRFAVSIWGFGEGEESWVISHQEIFGDPSQSEIWKQLDSILFRNYRHESGGTMCVAVASIDTGGHFTHEVYGYVRAKKHDRNKTLVIAVKGASVKNKPILGKPAKVDVNFRGQTVKNGVDLYSIGTDTAKTTIYARLRNQNPGPGYVHLPAYVDKSFFEQIVSERRVTRFVKGHPVSEYVKKPSVRNEALDCAVYAFGALQLLLTRFNRATVWDSLRRIYLVKDKVSDPVKEKLESIPVEEKAEVNEKLPASVREGRIRGNGRRSGFVTGW